MSRARDADVLMESFTRVPGGRAIPITEIRQVRLDDRVPFVAARPDDGPTLDAAAGCEFIDDRVRLRE